MDNLNSELTEILKESLNYSRSSRGEKDLFFLRNGINRVLNQCESGRAYLQMLQGTDLSISRATYFNSLQSSRYRDVASESEKGFLKIMQHKFKKSGIDHLRKFSELDKYGISAFDGHFKKHACHAMRDKKNAFRAVGGILSLDLRTGLIEQRVSTEFDLQKKNEMRAFKEMFSDLSKNNEPLICVVDKAYVDGQFWEKWRKAVKKGLYVLSLMKENMKPISETSIDFDKNNPYNCGIVSDSIIEFKSGAEFRKIVYIDPETNKEYNYITTVKDVSPGLLAYLYLWRWKIEKSFDVFKNKFHEKKSWSNGEKSADIQSTMLVMTYNFLLYTQEITLEKFNIKENKLDEKRKRSVKKREEIAKSKGMYVHPLILLPCKFFQMSQQYIRCFREIFRKSLPWVDSLSLFKRAMMSYL